MQKIGSQNQNIKTTISYDEVDVTVEVKSNRNASYLERMIYLHDDEKSYQYIYFYGPITQTSEHTSSFAKVQEGAVKESRKVWRNYKRLFDKTIEMMNEQEFYDSEDEDDDEVDKIEDLKERIIKILVKEYNTDENMTQQIRDHIENDLQSKKYYYYNIEDFGVYAESIFTQFTGKNIHYYS